MTLDLAKDCYYDTKGISNNRKKREASGLTQVVQCLAGKCETLNSNLSTTKKKKKEINWTSSKFKTFELQRTPL
jgi:hypothetical protein